MAEANLKVIKREEKGKQASKHLRQNGFIPGILYGFGMEPLSLTVDLKELLLLLHSVGRNAVFNLSIGKNKKKYTSFIYDIQHNPISGEIIHIDLKQISLTEKIHVNVPVHLTGLSFGVKNEGAIVEHIMHAIEVACLPADIPVDIKIDITDLHLGDVIHVKDIPHENFEILSAEDSVVLHLIAPKVVKVEEVEEEIVEEGEEAAAEPEVIGEAGEKKEE